jgi:multiple sugar transport system substrate-binding protein
MSKWIRASSVAVVAVALLAGLAGGNSRAASSSGTRSNASVVHLTYWNMWSGIWEPIVKKMVADFMRTHPNIQVTTLSVPGQNAATEQKLLTAIAAGKPPDVFTEWNPMVAAFAAKHAVLDLGQFMTGKYAGLKHWFYPVAAEWGTYQGKMYAMPWTMNSFMLYYNKTMMKQAGLNPDKPPTTIAQLDAQQARMWKINAKKQVEQIGFYPNWFDVWTPTWNAATSLLKDGKYDMTGPNAVKLMNWIASYKRYPYAQANAFIKGVTSGNGAADVFTVGKQAFEISGMWIIPTIQQFNPTLQYGVVPLPYPPGGNKNATWVNGNYNEILAGSHHPKEAFEFIAWLSGYDNAAWAARSYPAGGWIPNSPTITDQAAYQKFLNANPLRRPFVNIMLNPRDGITPVTAAEMLYETTLTNEVTAVLEGKETPMDALKHTQDKSNQELQMTGG